MKKKFCFVLLLIGYSRISNSQNDSVFKNEMGVNLIPAITVLSGDNYTSPLKHGLYYKRRITTRLFYRASVMYVTNRSNSPVDPFYEIAGQTDSSVFIKYNQNSVGNQLNLFQGLEFRWGKEKLKQFTGIDLYYSHRLDRYIQKYATLNKSASYANSNGASYFSVYPQTSFSDDSTVVDYTISRKGFGINPFYGMMFQLSKQFSFSAQLGVNMLLSYNEKKYRVDNFKALPHYSPFWNLDFTTTGFLNNFSLFYRF